MNILLNVVQKFNKEDIPRIFELIKQQHSHTNEKSVLKHSIVDLSENKVYYLEFPMDFDGNNLDKIIKSVEKWKNESKSNDIFIGNELYIRWKEVDWENEPHKDVDSLIAPLNDLFRKLETSCVRMCCGIEAFDFRPQSIRNAGASMDVDWKGLLSQIIFDIENINQRVVSSLMLNQLFEKSVFIQLMTHLKANLIPENEE